MKKANEKTIVILGPTASGKSELAVEIAKKFNGEIISADSRQVYKGMDIGTGKITRKEMENIPHYLLDIASPRIRFSAARFKDLGQKAIKDIRKKGKLPIICGGTGFYIQTLTDNLNLPEIKPDLKLRAKLEKDPTEKLYSSLKKLDPERAKNIDPNNRRRLIRAIEIIKKTGKPVPKLKAEKNRGHLFIGIKLPPAELKKRIEDRLLKRIGQGMINEVGDLHKHGLSWKKLDDFGLEYRWVAKYLQNKISYEQMVSSLKKEIKHFAKRQMTWFKRDKRIKWIKSKKEAQKLVQRFIEK